MANVESDKPMLRGLTPPILPSAGPSMASAGQDSETAAADDGQRERLQQALMEQGRDEGAVAIPEFELDAPGDVGAMPEPVQHLDSERTPVLTLEQAREHVAAELPRAAAPRQLRLVEALPLLASGKLDRAALRLQVT